MAWSGRRGQHRLCADWASGDPVHAHVGEAYCEQEAQANSLRALREFSLVCSRVHMSNHLLSQEVFLCWKVDVDSEV